MVDEPRFTILIVEDTKANIDVLVNLLDPEYDVRVALDGERALRFIAAEPPDLILLDIMMPGLDGYEVCRRIKADEGLKDIPVIFITALGDEGAEVKGLALGAADYVPKPFSPAIVKARVANHLALFQARRDLRRQNDILQENARLREDVERITRHDLKSPITAIINLPQLLMDKLDTILDEEDRSILQLIEEQGYRMLDMVNLALDMYKMETGSYVCRSASVDVLRIVRKIRKEFSMVLELRHIELRLSLDGRDAGEADTFVVQAEALLCHSMFANLIKNALEAAPEHSVVTVACAYDDAAAIAIHNLGVVPEAIRERFFEKYATSGKDRGTGLGTYSARLIAETQGGSIAMTTTEATGTTITVRLPVAQFS